MEKKEELLSIRGLSIRFRQYKGGSGHQAFSQADLSVISGLDVTVRRGEVVAVVGASGSGKSLLAHAVLGLLPANAFLEGSIRYRGKELCPQDQKGKKKAFFRSRESGGVPGIALVPQSVTWLDPLMKIGRQVLGGRKTPEARQRMRMLFARYGLSGEVENLYPFECSGGMIRRILLTAALMDDPELIIADEPTPGMDASLAKQAMDELRGFADEGGGVLLITHDIELALRGADRIAVFYAGTTVEVAAAADFEEEKRLRHPYTKALWRAMPANGFAAVSGMQPYVKDLPEGCVYQDRCPYFSPACRGKIPLRSVRGGLVRCIRPFDREMRMEKEDSDPGWGMKTGNVPEREEAAYAGSEESDVFL
ncbi:MAG TPA: ABC transporter ATP-binding protein [Candidatus Eisenbergiella merdipullorum]|uniref:Nickel import system ATP-binding protein NikD n=1 Tax=Candidatus Eisenbergiella merdipullorum TaxID=2838553 RepID=A0A9D2KZY2_9FIRM|nr:ABC transporter ATP-binding protein [Candidatus Eisenbergiella merdipullorum]